MAASNGLNSTSISRLDQVLESRTLIAAVADRGFVLPEKNLSMKRGQPITTGPAISKAPNLDERNLHYECTI